MKRALLEPQHSQVSRLLEARVVFRVRVVVRSSKLVEI